MGVHDADYKKIKKLLGVPEDEPIFVLRGQDDLAAATVARYRNMASGIEDPDKVPSEQWLMQMEGTVREFTTFRANNPDRIKIPD